LQLSGTQVCRMLKADPQTSYIPVLMLGENRRSDFYWSLAAGADECLLKDAAPDQLLSTARQLLARNLQSIDSFVGQETSLVRSLSQGVNVLERELFQASLLNALTSLNNVSKNMDGAMQA